MDRSTKYLLNSLTTSVRDNLIGLALTNSGVQVAQDVDAIIRKDVDILRQRKCVFLISGGGAGHEPMFAGFVGPHLLTAAVSGSYFASPSAGQIVKLIEQIATMDTPILLVLANYTGDRLNFGLAKEQLAMKGYHNIELFVFGDDLAPFLTNTNNEDVGAKRRGLAGITLIHKIAGVLSERGKSLCEIQNSLSQFSKLIFTISISLSAADIPGHGASFQLEPDSMELGLGVHGESGVKRVNLLSAADTIDMMLVELVNYLNKQNLLEQYNNRIVLLVNNLGGLTQIETNVILKEVVEQMRAKSITIERIYWGPYMTSFNMKGVSLSVMLINEQLLDILDEADRNAFVTNTINDNFIYKSNLANANQDSSINSHQLFKHCTPSLYKEILSNACNSIIKNEHKLNKLDGTVGDSDCGSTLSSIAKLFLNQIEPMNNGGDYPPSFADLARIVSEDIGGSSGALYSLLFTAAFNYCQTGQGASTDSTDPSVNCLQTGVRFWHGLVQHCITTISTYSGAKPNDRSMIDALYGIEVGLKQLVDKPAQSVEDICNAVSTSTWSHANKTSTMKARVGRAAYVNEAYVIEPDAGAIAVAIWIQEVVDTLRKYL